MNASGCWDDSRRFFYDAHQRPLCKSMKKAPAPPLSWNAGRDKSEGRIRD